MKKFNNKTYKHSFLYLILLNFLNKPIPTELEPLYQVTSIFFILSLLALSSFFSLIIIYTSLYLNSKYNISEKFINYPFIIKIISWSIKVSKIFIIIDTIICFTTIFGMFIFTIIILGLPFIT